MQDMIDTPTPIAKVQESKPITKIPIKALAVE